MEENSTASFKDIFKTDTPPKDFFDLRKTSIPQTYEIAKERAEANLLRFRTYYLSISILFVFVFFLLKPSFGLFLGIVGISIYLHHTQPTIKGVTVGPKIINIGTAVGLFICAFLFNSTLVSILALISLLTFTILSHAITFEKVEVEEDGV
ncbi:hypothetical protein NGRA_0154 [Nosema granulosis]|uniref:PRA1 family protein n=1 Tax=Nosema granulosis TaxID=83296 RepID=A0A9P6H1G7_9MICR|nr:hypothetical protein NGRA_0154 [Nosema granulosis]